MDGTGVIAVSRTRAMMAARALRKTAEKQRAAAPDLKEWGYETAAANAETLGEWYDDVAAALEQLDTAGAVLRPAPDVVEAAS